MRLDYDKEANAVYIAINDCRHGKTVQLFGGRVMVDNRIRGIEILYPCTPIEEE